MGRLAISFKNEADALPNYFRHQLYEVGGGTQMVVTGGRGVKVRCGKSIFSAGLGEKIDPERFSIDDIVYTAQDYTRRLKRFREEKGGKGRVVIWDEGEMLASSKSWQSLMNKTVTMTLATQGYLNNLTIIVAPLFSMLDSQIRKLVPHWTWCEKQHFLGKTHYYAYFRIIETDIIGDNIYFKKPRFYDEVNKKRVAVRRFEFGLPSDELYAQFVKKENNNKKIILDDLDAIALKLDKIQEEELKEDFSWKAKAEKLLSNPIIIRTLTEKGKLSSEDVSCVLDDLSRPDANHLAKMSNILWSGKKNG